MTRWKIKFKLYNKIYENEHFEMTGTLYFNGSSLTSKANAQAINIIEGKANILHCKGSIDKIELAE